MTVAAMLALCLPAGAQEQNAFPLQQVNKVTGSKPKVSRPLKAAVPQADLSLYAGRRVYASQVSADNWQTAGYTTPYGIYYFDIAQTPVSVPVSTATDMNYYAGSWGRDMFLGVRARSLFGALSGVVYQGLDTLSFAKSWEKDYGDHYDYSKLASIMAYDVTSDLIYSVQFNADNTGMLWAYFDRASREFVSLHQWTNDFQPLTLAADNEGKMYAIGDDGYYYEIDKATGEASMLGETGVTASNYLQSMAYDGRTGSFLWSAITPEGSKLYAVDRETGAASLIASFGHYEENIALFLKTNEAPDKAPAAITDLAYDFAGTGATSGNLTFTVPQTAYDGSTLTGNLKMTVWLDGKAIASGVSVTPGSAQSFPVSLSNDNHYVDVSISNASGVSPYNYLYSFAGYDTPKAVTDLTFTAAGGTNSLTWTAPAGGVNNGYVDFDNLYYNIVRLPDSVTVAEGLKATAFSETTPEKMERYSYLVTPYNGAEKPGAAARSNGVLAGQSFNVPYEGKFDTEDERNLWTIIDANNDDVTWQYNDYGNCMTVNTNAFVIKDSTNDWLISPAVHLNVGETYGLTVNMRNTWEDDPERVKLMIGTSLTDTASFKLINEYYPLETKGDLQDFKNDFTVEKEGNYYFAIVNTTPVNDNNNAAFVHSLSVEKQGNNNVPAEVEDLALVPDSDGALKATLNFTAPSKTLGGDNLEGTLTAKIYRDSLSNLVGEVKDVVPGSKVSYIDEKVNTVGPHVYTVTASNALGEGKKASVREFIGIYGTPYVNEFDDEASIEYFTIQHNQEGAGNPCQWTWSSYDHNLQLGYYSTKAPIDIYEFMPAIKLDADAVYEWSFKWQNTSYNPISCEATVGMKADSTAQKTLVTLPKTSWGHPAYIKTNIVTTDAGRYYGAFHTSATEAGYLSVNVDSVVVKYVASAKAPAGVENLTVKADEGGALKATVAFTAPKVDYAGRTLTDPVDISLYRGETAVPFKTFKAVTPGEEMTFIDEEPLQGFNQYMVVPTNSYGRGKAEADTVYVGFDYPLAVTNLKAKGDLENKNAQLTWTAPSEGVHGGLLGDITYIIVAYNPAETDSTKQMTLIAQNVKDTTYTVEMAESDEQALRYFLVMAVTKAGNGAASIASVVLGKPYTLPFKESFNNGASTNTGWVTGGDNMQSAAWIHSQDDNTYSAEDNDNGYIALKNVNLYWGSNLNSYITSPKLKSTGSDSTYVNFWLYQGISSYSQPAPGVQLMVSSNDGDFQNVGDKLLITDGTAGWTEHRIDLGTVPEGFFSVRFLGNNSRSNDIVMIDNIVIDAETVDGIGRVGISDNVRGLRNGISVLGYAGKTVEVYSLAGQLVDRFVSDGNVVRNMRQGIYIVRVNGHAAKVTVR